MKKRPKSLPSLHSATFVDRKWACGLLTLAMLGGTGIVANAAGAEAQSNVSVPQASSQKHQITGTVVDETGEPMIGVSVIQQGTTTGVATDFDGNYTLSVPAGATLQFTYIGYKTKSVKVGNQTTIDVTMEPDTEILDDVVVIGYGTMKKSDLTGAVSSVGTEALNAKGAPSAIEALQGSTPGVNIVKTQGRANGSYDVQIRGKSSINSDTKPLYIVDGVMCDDIDFLNPQDIERIDVLKDASSTAIYGSRATAGVIMVTTRGGLNVNKSVKTSVSYDGYYGINHAARMPDFMDGQEFYNYRFAKFTNAVTPFGPQTAYAPKTQVELGQALLQETKNDYTSPFRLREMIANGETVDWPSLVTRDGNQQNHYLAVGGSSETASYHFGIGYNSEDGLYRGDGSKTYSFKGSVDARINKVLSAGFTMNLARIDTEYADDGAISNAYRVNCFMQPYDADGKLNRYPGAKGALGTDDHQFSDFVNPLYSMKNQTHEKRQYRALGNVYLQLDIIKGLNVKTTFAPSYSSSREGTFAGYIDPDTGMTYAGGDPSSSEAKVLNSTSFSYVWDNTINFNRTFNDVHNVNFMGLFSMEKSETEKYQIVANGVIDGTDWWNIGSGSPTSNPDDKTKGVYSSYDEWSMLSYALRANYNYKGRYFITGTMRWDGSSRFADGYRWGSFPSVAVAWRISDENFLRDISWIDNLKIRASFGKTGNNAGIGNFATIVGIDGPYYYPFGPDYSQGFYPTGIVDKLLKWETSNEWNFGLDFGFINSRINGSIEFYNKKSNDLLYPVELPLEAGGGTMKTNIGRVHNHGIELSLNTINITNRTFEWTTTLNLAHNRNKVTEINGVGDFASSSDVSKWLFVGRPFDNVYTWAWDGIVSDRNMVVPNHQIAIDKGFTPGETVRSADYYYATYGLTEGQPIIRDVNGDGQITDDDKVIFDSQPDFTGSFTSNMTYNLPKKGGSIDFSFNLYASVGGKVASPFLGGDYYDQHDRGRGKMMFDYYIPAGTLIDCDGMRDDGTYINPVYQTETHYGKWPTPNCGDSDGIGTQLTYFQAARQVTNASFMKVKNITVGYSFAPQLLKHIGCQRARLYFTVTNPFVFTKYEGYDPEWATAALKYQGPSVISYQIGASIKF
ncbi:MAG: TonB-dependent receptor [Staphylococcus sp.]|nr:TonB-dependent receptor [Staphylococcus sp.]